MSIEDFKLLRGYFENIIAACNNLEKDERPYIKTIAECGIDILKKNYTNGVFKV